MAGKRGNSKRVGVDDVSGSEGENVKEHTGTIKTSTRRMFLSFKSFHEKKSFVNPKALETHVEKYEPFFERFESYDWKDMNKSVLKAMMTPAKESVNGTEDETPWIYSLFSLPTSPTKQKWGLLVMLMASFEAVLLPVQVTFKDYIPSMFTILISYFVDVVFILDVIAGFTATYLDADGLEVRDPRAVIIHYLRTWFIVDLIASLPGGVFIVEGGSNTTALIARSLKLPRAFRVVKFAKLYYEKWGQGKLIGKSIQVILSIVIMVHWMCCVHVVVVESNETSSWFYDNQENFSESGFNSKYMVYLYGTVEIILGTGSPTTIQERMFATTLHLVGLILQAIVLGEVTLVIQKLSAKSTKWKFKMDEINESMKYMGLPNKIQKRVRNYFAFSWAVYGGDGGGNKWLDEVSDTLHSKVKISVDEALLKKVPLFEGASSNFVEGLLMKLRTQLYLPGDHVIKYGVLGDCMFFIVKGVLEALSQDESVCFSLMNEGHFFGEIALLKNDATRTATVRAVTYAQLNVLFKEDFLDLLLQYPEQAANVLKIAEQRQKNTTKVLDYKQREDRRRSSAVNTKSVPVYTKEAFPDAKLAIANAANSKNSSLRYSVTPVEEVSNSETKTLNEVGGSRSAGRLTMPSLSNPDRKNSKRVFASVSIKNKKDTEGSMASDLQKSLNFKKAAQVVSGSLRSLKSEFAENKELRDDVAKLSTEIRELKEMMRKLTDDSSAEKRD